MLVGCLPVRLVGRGGFPDRHFWSIWRASAMQTSRTTYIYGLECPIAGRIRYVGKAGDPNARFKQHLYRGDWSNPHKRRWLDSLAQKQMRPRLVVLEAVTSETWKAAEMRWIKRLRAEGHHLTNITGGGDGWIGDQAKEKITFRLDPDVVLLIKDLSRQSGKVFGTKLSQAQIVEKAVNKLAREKK